ncbi:MAG TPA: SDR family NAD(P)-dependent oxidoreductase [Mycobacteriales bacterium]|nr:SDR family NAD(P)-dependent oxidoreductase [Mycobacteriales bacterium]
MSITVDLSGRRILVTGASSGLGAATCRAVVECGGSVAMIARRADRLSQLEAELGDRAIGIRGDVTDGPGLETAIAQGAERLGGYDGVVSVAGKSMVGAIATGTPQAWRDLVELNFLGSLSAVHYGLKHFAERGRRDVVIVGSVAALTPMPGTGLYSATKSALLAACESMRHELAPTGIGVGVVMPGMFDTEGLTLEGLVMDGPFPTNEFPVMTPDTVPGPAHLVGDAIAFMLGQPEGTTINELVVRPTGQLNP